MKIRTALLLLTVLAITLALSSCDNTPRVYITGENAAAYTIIRPEQCSAKVVDAAVKLRAAITEATGVELTIADDWVKRGTEPDSTAYEILIGATNRPQSVTATEPLSDVSMHILTDGNKIVITGGSDDSVVAAVDYFISDLMKIKRGAAAVDAGLNYLSLMPSLVSPADGVTLSTLTPTFEWENMPEGKALTLTLEIDGTDGYAPYAVYDVTGKNSFTPDAALSGCSAYRWKLSAGDTEYIGGIFMTEYNYLTHPANTGIDYSFNGPMSETVLCNYLSRAINHFYFVSTSADSIAQNKRFVLNIGAKFIGRSSTMWGLTSGDEATIRGVYTDSIADIHNSDPEVIFEACIFEYISPALNDIAIPSWVFEEFGMTPETRNFSYDAMLYPDGTFVDHWGTNGSVPDMRQTETQMWFYYRARLFIDAGFEALHLGQVHLIGNKDTDFRCWTEVLGRIRAYAADHARRGWVLLNAHTHGIVDAEGLLMFDFHRFPIRAALPFPSEAHSPTEDEPQEMTLRPNYGDSLFGRSLGGKTHAGWDTDMLPYLVELDNYVGVVAHLLDKPVDYWGFDEISWWVNQPTDYRNEWLSYATEWVGEIDGKAGHFEMPGTRTSAIRTGVDISTITQAYFYPFSKQFAANGTDTEQVIRDIWVASNK